MKKTTSSILGLILLLNALTCNAQTENFEKGLEAIQNNRYHEAMISFTHVVENEKFEISGKDLSIAYGYLAQMRTAYLQKDLANSDFNNIIIKQGHIKTTIHEMVRAEQFQTNSSKSMLEDSKKTLIEISTNALKVLGDSLLSYDENYPTERSEYLASFAIGQFGELENITVDDWQIHDILGLAHYHLGEKEKAMTEFGLGREQFSRLAEQPLSQIHLKNYIISSNYYFKEKDDGKMAYKISEDGSEYTSVLINSLGDDQMNEILRLNKIENRFRQYMTRIDESGK